MNEALKVVSSFFDIKDVSYKIIEDNDAIRLSWSCENRDSLELIVFFDEGNDSIAIRAFNYCTFPKEKLPLMYETCSRINKEYRWIKFYVDEDDNTINLAEDAVIQLDSCGEETLELAVRMVGIGDEVYPKFMKAIWS